MKKLNQAGDVLFEVVFILVAVVLVTGATLAIKSAATRNAVTRQQECERIAKVAHADEWREKDYNCLIVRDGKVIYDE